MPNYSSICHPIPFYSSISQPIPANSSLFQPITAFISLFLPIPAHSSLFQHIPAHSNLVHHITVYSSLFQPIPAYSSLFPPVPTYSRLCFPIPAYSILFQPILAYSSYHSILSSNRWWNHATSLEGTECILASKQELWYLDWGPKFLRLCKKCPKLAERKQCWWNSPSYTSSVNNQSLVSKDTHANVWNILIGIELG